MRRKVQLRKTGLKTFRTEFLNHDTVNILGQIILCCEDFPLHSRMFNSIPDVHPLGGSTVHSDDDQMFLDIARCTFEGQECSQLRNTSLERHRVYNVQLNLPEN